MRISKRWIALMIVFLMVFGHLGTAVAAAAGDSYEYTLSEETIIREDETPLGVSPDEHSCCVLHFILGLCALGVTVYYARERKNSQTREFELRAGLK